MAAHPDAYTVYVGTFQGEGEDSLFRLRFDPAFGRLKSPAVVARIAHSSFLAFHPTGRYLYAVSEVDGGAGGAVCAFAIPPDSRGAHRLLSRRPTLGRSTCHVSVDATGRCVLVANYAGPSVALFQVRPDGGLDEASAVVRHAGGGVHPRQSAAHPHMVRIDPTNRFVYVPDLGTDEVVVYRLDSKAGTLVGHGESPAARAVAGAGPRHLDFHRNLPYAYVVNELDSTVTAYAWDRTVGSLRELQRLSALPEGFQGGSTCADIHVHPDGRFLYASNRGDDSIAVFRIDADSGQLTPAGHVSTGGRTPRNFAIDPTGAFLLVANQDSDSIAVFRIDLLHGTLIPLSQLPLPKPACIRFAPERQE